MQELGHKARKAAGVLALASTAQKNDALLSMAKAIRASANKLIAANASEVAAANAKNLKESFIDRLTLNMDRVAISWRENQLTTGSFKRSAISFHHVHCFPNYLFGL